jgi:hypothetical protein
VRVQFTIADFGFRLQTKLTIAFCRRNFLRIRLRRNPKVEFKPDLCLCVTREMYLDAFREQAFAPALPPARQRGAARFRFHARTKSVLLFARAFGWLVSAFHKTEK